MGFLEMGEQFIHRRINSDCGYVEILLDQKSEASDILVVCLFVHALPPHRRDSTMGHWTPFHPHPNANHGSSKKGALKAPFVI